MVELNHQNKPSENTYQDNQKSFSLAPEVNLQHVISNPIITPENIIHLQRTIGNQAVIKLIQNNQKPSNSTNSDSTIGEFSNKSKLPIQRSVSFKQMTGETTNPTKEQIKVWLARSYSKDVIDGLNIDIMLNSDENFTFEWAYDQNKFVKECKHQTWLLTEAQKYLKKAQGFLAPLMSHDDTLENPAFEHFNAFDDNMLWRFTSQPTQEVIQIESGVSYDEILKVVANHSGGNDKSNQRVRTLSFGRNIGALMGTAYSQGGDKNVAKISQLAAYLYGIDINSLKGKGITAHPATARAISLFETEYILVSTPGNDPVTLDDLATVKFKNPFRQPPKTKKDKKVIPDVVSDLTKMDKKQVQSIILFAKAVMQAANKYKFVVQDKEPIFNQKQMEQTIKKYISDIEKLLK